MIALTPQFASLLVSITASAVSAAPNPRLDAQDRRYVVGVDVPGLAKVHLQPRTSESNSRILGRHHEREQEKDVEEPVDTKASAGNGPDLDPSQFFLDASSSRNASTIYVVDSGHPTSVALASQFNNTNATSEHIVSLQMAFVNTTSGQVQAYCATFDTDGAGGQSALAAKPCITDGVTSVPHASQSFGWNRANEAVRPLWNEAGNDKRKRAYVVQAGSSSAAVMNEDGENKPESVVLVFQPFEAQAPTNETSTDPSSEKDATGAGADEDPTVPAPDPTVAAMEDEDDSIPVFVAGVNSS
ncbi:hypothetical protein FRC07_005930 [Ceratobasidium sp. 392]|nr:hypothetical protein FRC07_005930 [Ceratobasidium sp. 392]